MTGLAAERRRTFTGTDPSSFYNGKFNSAADTARHLGWTVGTKIRGTDSRSTITIEITAIGERLVLGKTIRGSSFDRECSYTFDRRDWQVVA